MFQMVCIVIFIVKFMESFYYLYCMVVSFVYMSWMSGSSDWRFWIIFLCMAPKKKAYSKCLSVVSGDTAKTVERVTSGVAWLGMTVGGHPTVEHTVAFCELMRVIREKPGLCQLFESDLVAYLGEYVNEQARIGAAMRVCTLVSKLRAVNTEDLDTIGAFYLGMIEYDKRPECLGVDVPNEDASRVDILDELEARLRFVGLLEEEARLRVSRSAADRLSEYADLLNAQIDVVRAFGKMDT